MMTVVSGNVLQARLKGKYHITCHKKCNNPTTPYPIEPIGGIL